MDSLYALFAIPISYLVLAFIAAGARFLISKEVPTLKRLFSVIVYSLLVVIVGYTYLEEKQYSKATILLITTVLGFLAEDVLKIILRLVDQIKANPLKLIIDFINWRKGGGD